MASKAHSEANVRYNRSRDNLMIRPTKEEGSAIRAAAADAGQSVQQFVLDAVRVRMKWSGAGGSKNE
jgi:uncharacterized protein (DUF1778 family)